MIALFVLWVALGNIVVLCFVRRYLRNLKEIPCGFTAYILSLSVTFIISLIALWITSTNAEIASPYLLQPRDFLIRNMTISAIVSAVALRYFYVQHQWKSNIQAEARSRIQALQARIRPHFLFNSMNTIAALTRTSPELAEKAVEDLADLFRASLGQQEKVTLQEELGFVRGYINIEQLRLGERLKIGLNLGEGLSLSAVVPALILQPLVENAIYHGIEPLTEGGTVTINITSDDMHLKFAITNPIPKVRDKRRPGNQMAQENIRQRLQLAYGERTSMKISQTDIDYTVSFNIPIEEQ